MNKSQKEFEAWFYNDLSEAAGVYHLAWQAWQASRAALVFELPDVCDLYPRKMLESELIKKIEKAGVKYK
jgi:hypothetical protein